MERPGEDKASVPSQKVRPRLECGRLACMSKGVAEADLGGGGLAMLLDEGNPSTTRPLAFPSWLMKSNIIDQLDVEASVQKKVRPDCVCVRGWAEEKE